MSRIFQHFQNLKSKNEAALVAYVTVGDPDYEISKRAVCTLIEAGVDVVELGIAFSDPLADGPVIQAAAQRALLAGTTPAHTLKLVKELRADYQTPLIAMTYFNPVLQYGLSRFAFDAGQAGLDGVILTDLPPEGASEWLETASQNGLDTIFLLAPTSTDKRIQIVCESGSGFVYCVSRTGVTGSRSDIPPEVSELVSRVRSATDKPVVVGFGISNADHVSQISDFADGAVVGSAIVEFIAKNHTCPDFEAQFSDFVQMLKKGTRRS
ncbi:MAG: tryptophan synthase subunit alpha [bacterium]